MEIKGLNFEELEAQEFGLLPDRVEMTHRRRRRRGRRITNTAVAVSSSESSVNDSGNSAIIILSFNTVDVIGF